MELQSLCPWCGKHRHPTRAAALASVRRQQRREAPTTPRLRAYRVAVTGQVAQHGEQFGVSGGLALPVLPGGQVGCLLDAGAQRVQVLRGHLPAGDAGGRR
jgi:hypothetical protein